MSQHCIDLLRHGEVRGGPCFRGQRDDPLTDQGYRQMDGALRRHAARHGGGWTGILTSPATRCRDFGADFARQRGLELTELADLAERHFGAWEGLQASEIPLADLSAFWADPHSVTPRGAESFSTFRRRVLDAWRRLIQAESRGEPDATLILTHGGVIRVILGDVLSLPDQSLLLLEVPPACITRVRIPLGGGLPSLVGHWPPEQIGI